MLNDNDIREIKKILNAPETGSWFSRRRQKSKKKELIGSLDELDFTMIKLYNGKVQRQINSIKKEIEDMND